MTDTSTADELPHQTNGVISDNGIDEEDRAKMRPADIDADVREMERRKRVELIMNSKLFREELERIIETQLKDGTGTSGLLQQISDMVGVNKQAGNVFKSSSCVIPINDIRGIESMGYAKGEKILRCKLASVFRLIDLYGWTQGANTLITARLNQDEEQFLVNPYGMLFHEITASSLIKCDMQGTVLEQGTTNFPVNVTAFSLHAAAHAARPDLRCIIQVHTPSVVAISALKHGMLPLSQESVVVGEISTHPYLGGLLDADEKDKLARNLGPVNKVLLLSNQGALCCGETIEEAFFNARNVVLASESQLKLLPLGLDNLVVLNDEARKKIYDGAHRAPDSSPRPDQPSILETKVERKWRVGGVEFEALMRMMDNAGFRTGYIYRQPLVKGEPPKPRNDVEVPPAVSSLGYLLEEEELYRQGIWRKLEGGKKGHDRSRWLNSPNVYQKVEILETGTPDPKKITKWVAEHGTSPNHSTGTPVKIDGALQFVPKGTNPKEFKSKQQQIKDYRRADKISAGPQSHILEGVTWEEAKKMQDATVSQTGDQVVLMGAASKGIIQRGHQHNAMVYKSPYAKNPFDCVTDEELEDYKKVVEKRTKGEYDTDYSESEGLSSAQLNKRMDGMHIQSPTSETEEESRGEPQILRIETRTAPKPSQPEVVLSDGYQILTVATTNRLIARQYQYRTNSHLGLPKGSYIVPNPVHYHVARQKHIAEVLKPRIVSVVPIDNHRFNSNITFNNNRRQSRFVQLKLKDANSVTLDISLDSLKSFIRPFARALNFDQIPALNNQGSQTSYMKNFDRPQPSNFKNVEYTPLYVDTHTNTLKRAEKDTQFEQKILDNLQQNLMTDFENELSSEGQNSEDTSSGDIRVFDENDDIQPNESLIEITPDIAELIPQSNSSSSQSSTENQKFPDKLPYSESEQENVEVKEENLSHSIVDVADQFTSDFAKVVDDFETAMNVINEVKQILSRSTSTSVINGSSEQSLSDEGIGELTNNGGSPSINENCDVTNLDPRVVRLGDFLKDFLVKQSYEIKDLVLFPEPRNDAITQKFLADLSRLYHKLYTECLQDEQKTEMRLSLASYVLRMLEQDERIKDKNDSSNSDTTLNISDKLFSVSEFLSEILDTFYNSLDNNGTFSNFTQNLSDQNNAQSTPRVKKKSAMRKLNNSLDELVSDEVISFKKDTKMLTETYWVTINPSPSRFSPLTHKKTIINIDDIPLKPPEDFNISRNKVKPKRQVLNIDEMPLKPPSDVQDLNYSSPEEQEFDENTQESKILVLQNIIIKPPNLSNHHELPNASMDFNIQDTVNKNHVLDNPEKLDQYHPVAFSNLSDLENSDDSKTNSNISLNNAEKDDFITNCPNNTKDEFNFDELPSDHHENLLNAVRKLSNEEHQTRDSENQFMSDYEREMLENRKSLEHCRERMSRLSAAFEASMQNGENFLKELRDSSEESDDNNGDVEHQEIWNESRLKEDFFSFLDMLKSGEYKLPPIPEGESSGNESENSSQITEKLQQDKMLKVSENNTDCLAKIIEELQKETAELPFVDHKELDNFEKQTFKDFEDLHYKIGEIKLPPLADDKDDMEIINDPSTKKTSTKIPKIEEECKDFFASNMIDQMMESYPSTEEIKSIAVNVVDTILDDANNKIIKKEQLYDFEFTEKIIDLIDVKGAPYKPTNLDKESVKLLQNIEDLDALIVADVLNCILDSMENMVDNNLSIPENHFKPSVVETLLDDVTECLEEGFLPDTHKNDDKTLNKKDPLKTQGSADEFFTASALKNDENEILSLSYINQGDTQVSSPKPNEMDTLEDVIASFKRENVPIGVTESLLAQEIFKDNTTKTDNIKTFEDVVYPQMESQNTRENHDEFFKASSPKNDENKALKDILRSFDGENSYICYKDDIDNIATSSKKCSFSRKVPSLSPIREEPKYNLFESHLAADKQTLEDSYFSIDNTSISYSGDEEFASPLQDNLVSSPDSDNDTYNIVVCNEVTFFRGDSETRPPFCSKKKVFFSTEVFVEEKTDKSGDDKENSCPNKSGDWMGYESAKF